ncbi:MAG: hypothetical protein CBC35_12120 [Planctomycetes bacterium TMED75]|nr:hypothetical protein [Planctomycetaceae bacterium]OUU90293.1 MAG: hypothetical protein CBC35_12120 [Planctomycetes bacterium TMED75]
MMPLIAWIPFLEPMPSPGSWWPLLLIPLAIGISMVYKAVRIERLEQYPREVLVMTGQIVGAMVFLALVLGLVVQVLIPLLTAD